MSKHNGMKGAELAQFQAELRQFCGTENWYRHPLNPRLVYTDGVQYLAEKAGAYWLIDVVASVQHTEPQLARHSFQSWKLTVDAEKATGLVACTDGNNTALYSQRIEYTDFPLPEIKLYCCADGKRHVLMLTSEY